MIYEEQEPKFIRMDLTRNNKGKRKRIGLKPEHINLYNHNDNSPRDTYCMKPPTLIVSIELVRKIAHELNLGEVKGRLSERLACKKKAEANKDENYTTAARSFSGGFTRLGN